MLQTLTSVVTKVVNPHTAVNEQANGQYTIPYHLSTNYQLFKEKYNETQIKLSDDVTWKLIDTGPYHKTPIIFIPGTTGTYHLFYQQIIKLGLFGYRVISLTLPEIYNVKDFVKSFNLLLDHLNVYEFHLMGTSLGGYLSLLYLTKCKKKVLSLILTNTFCNTKQFRKNSPYINAMYLPDFYLRRYVKSALPKNKQRALVNALSIDFSLKLIDKLNTNQLRSRLLLNYQNIKITNDDLNGNLYLYIFCVVL